MALGFTREDLEVCFQDKDRLTFEQFLHVIDGKTTGALRASIGLVTNFEDVYRYVRFAEIVYRSRFSRRYHVKYL